MAIATVEVDIRTPSPGGPPDGLITAYDHLVLEVGDLNRARAFYAELLGFAPDGEDAEGFRLRISADQYVLLVPRDAPRVAPDGGTHVAFAFHSSELKEVSVRLQLAQVAVHSHREDRPAEREQNRYCADPDGNRIQLVEAETRGIDHVALETHDIEWAETFYTHVLGGRVQDRVGWRMQDYVRAFDWGEGKEDCAPGTRRWDKRYTTVEGQARLPRPNAHYFVTFSPAATLGVYLAPVHRQEPPREQFRGTPRVGFRVAPGCAAELEERLRTIRLRCLHRSPLTGAPYERVGSSLFTKDPGGNFLELA